MRRARACDSGPVVAPALTTLVTARVSGCGRPESRLLKQERAEARQALVPLLSAEEDRRFLKWKESADREEAELMKHVRGYHVGEKLYHSDRWVAPAQVSER